MLRTPSTGGLSLFTGIATATVLSGAAVLTVVHAGCDEPGVYQPHDGVVELIGGCVAPKDLPIVPKPTAPPNPVHTAPALAP